MLIIEIMGKKATFDESEGKWSCKDDVVLSMLNYVWEDTKDKVSVTTQLMNDGLAGLVLSDLQKHYNENILKVLLLKPKPPAELEEGEVM